MAIEIISASAGSGKTHRLAEILSDALESGHVRPEAVVATTFTNRAAAELMERVRSRLVDAGRIDDAGRLGAARIGTVNSVCGRIVADFAFELGLSPRLRVTDEDEAARELGVALTFVLASGHAEALEELSHRLGDLDWRDAVERIVASARANGVAPTELARMGAQASAGLRGLLSSPAENAAELNRSLLQALAQFADAVEATPDGTKVTAEALQTARRCLAAARSGRGLVWSDWARLAALAPAKRSAAPAEPLRLAAARHASHPRLHADVDAVVRRVYAVAAEAMSAYAQHKRERGILDFVDQEALALDLLSRDDVRERLAAGIDLVLVDEFQDTSPIQLAIFLRLAGIAPRSVWVGDQKQSIFGFRGADPTLMDAAIEQILAGREPETLSRSWRSRPALVALTSDLFAPAFASAGIPPARVKLVAAREAEPSALGPIVEVWRLRSTNKDDDALALATAARAFLADASSCVRDPRTGAVRPATAHDVAILCRTNETCGKVAAALEGLGVPAVVPSPGLMSTLEAQAALGGLRLWADPRDSLARAILARLLDYADRPDAWLEAAFRGRERAFEGIGPVAAVAEARQADSLASPVAALDAVTESLALRERCLSWGRAETRLANLDALRAHAVRYERACAVAGSGATPGGLVAHLEALADEEVDSQALLAEGNAVTVGTWHAAKGLEWPITVLFDIDVLRTERGLGVNVVGSERGIDMADPLASRWIRWWFTPYGKLSKGIPFFARLEESAEGSAAAVLDRKQLLRLLYVGWTRARDTVVLATREGKLTQGILSLPTDGGTPLINEPEGPRARWAGHDVAIGSREAEPQEPAPQERTPGESYVWPGPAEHAPAFAHPSDLEGRGEVAAPVRIGPRIALSGTPDMQAVGEAVHAFLAADRASLDPQVRVEMAAGLLERWEVRSALPPEALLAASDALRAWIDSMWPGATWRREVPLSARLPRGTVLRGVADLVVESDSGFVLVDHKSFPGDLASAAERAATFAGQLRAYAEAIARATGRAHVGSFVHLPISGAVVELLPPGA
jgi:ATP-dependent helicase/nuclease subunit A